MTDREAAARTAVTEAGRRLLASGLIARTWGNLSARISESEFVVTPSGLAYETLRPEDLVRVRIADCGHDRAEGRPSSEKGIHADAYRLRPEVSFLIHTHQPLATVAGLAGRDLTGLSDPVLGSCVPCAGYGMPSTKRLRREVRTAEGRVPGCRAVLLRHHGALCLGRDAEDAFAVAAALEEACRVRLAPTLPQPPETVLPDYGSSVRTAGGFLLDAGGARTPYPLTPGALTGSAALHAAIYRRRREVACIRQETDALVAAVSREGKTLRPRLDDLAQIAGATVRCCRPTPAAIHLALRGRDAVLLRGGGALCLGRTGEDAEAVGLLLRKGCLAQLFAERVPCPPLGRMDALAQRLVYTLKYARRKTGGGSAPC